MLPKFVIIGSMKCGTSSLYYYLASHPDIVPSSIKETNFFKTSADFNKGLDWYRALFTGPGTYAFEASPNYTKRHIFPGVPERMHGVIPEAKLIYILRDPIERTVSHYIHNYAAGLRLGHFRKSYRILIRTIYKRASTIFRYRHFWNITLMTNCTWFNRSS